MDKKILEVLSILEDEDNRAAAVGKFNVSDAYAHAYSIVHSLLSVK